MRTQLFVRIFVAGAALLLPALSGHAEPQGTTDPVDYVRDIQPIFNEHCTRCHGSTKQRAGLRLDSAAGLLRGGSSGPAIVAGKSATSLLIKAITGAADTALMPPADQL